jgi:hypothetical protein
MTALLLCVWFYIERSLRLERKARATEQGEKAGGVFERRRVAAPPAAAEE